MGVRRTVPDPVSLGRRAAQTLTARGVQRRAPCGALRKKGAKVHMAVDTLGHLLALHVTPANEQDRSQVGKLVQAVQEETCSSVEIAFVDQGYTGETAANVDAAASA